MIRVRLAQPGDAAAMSEVLTASIRELCGADHHGDPIAVARWTANKTPAAVAAMMEAGASTFFLADRDGMAAGVGSTMGGSEIGLNYVHPAHRFAGVSKALLATMEAMLRAGGAAEARLVSTVTAHRFYLRAGWQDSGPREEMFGLVCQPMRKPL